MSDHFPDQVNINHIREAMWDQSASFASVMIGAGFSMNATPLQSGTRMPTWGELVRRLIDDLYPADSAEAAHHRNERLQNGTSTSAMLRIAEEYEIAFGRARLDSRLLQFVPDLSFEPGSLHTDLLSLKWKDVFTTNWDTLLERAAARHPERAYQVVATLSDISRSAQPRIVKLHGTFPNIRPFIVTEEDYRSYPECMAAFVNLVRQAAMECVLCLVGFSGSDPNFLSWTGWVRDQLGYHSPQIFLATLTRQSSSERQLLESRGVRLIDLSRLPGLYKIPISQRHRAALDWFIRNLRTGRRLTSLADWPRSTDKSNPPPTDDLASIPPGPSSRFPGFPAQTPIKPDESWLLETVETWQRARRCYPGWLVAPSATRQSLVRALSQSLRGVLRQLTNASLAVQLVTLKEMIWQMNVCHLPLMKPHLKAVLDTIAAVRSKLEGKRDRGEAFSIRMVDVLSEDREGAAKEDRLSARTEVGEAWIDLNFALLRNARELGKLAQFETYLGVLREEVGQTADLHVRLCYERCLLAASRLDLKALTAAVQSWPEESRDPYFGVLRASILAEMGDLLEAERLCARSIERLRTQRRPGVDDIAATSRECWAMVLYLGLQTTRSFRASDTTDRDAIRASEEVLRQKLQDLAPIAGDPWIELDAASNAINSAQSERRQSQTRLMIVGDGQEAQFLPALIALRLVDDVGLPAQVGNALITRNLRLRAIDLVKPLSLSLATIASLRVGTVEDRFEEFRLFDRTWIARLDVVEAEALSRRLSSYLAVALGRYRADRGFNSNLAHYWQERCKFAAQLHGKLVTRLSVERINEVVSEAIEYFRREEVDHVWLQDSFTFLFTEAVNALPSDAMAGFLVKLLEIPYRPNDAPFNWPSPLVAIERLRSHPGRERVDERLAVRINSLLKDAASDRDDARSEALLRLAILFANNLLESAEIQRFTAALYDKPDEQGFPQVRHLRYDALVRLPEPYPGAADKALRRKYLWDYNAFDLPDALRNSVSFRMLESLLSSLVVLVGRRHASDVAFKINAVEADALTKRLINIYDVLADGSRRDPFGFDRAGLLNLIQIALAEAAIPNVNKEDQAVVSLIENSLKRWREEDHDSVLEANLSAARLPLGERWPVEGQIGRGLRSHRAATVKRSLKAAERWLRHGPRWGISKPGQDVFTTIGLLVEDGWPEILPDLLSTAAALTDCCATELDASVFISLKRGLSYLAEQTDYAQIDTQGELGIEPEQVPFIREGCARLALSLEKAGDRDAIVSKWVTVAKADPLWEVRKVFDEA